MDNKRPTESDYDEVGLRRPPDELNTGETYWQAAALQRGIERYRIDQEYWAKKEWERRPETVECAGCQSSIPVKATGWLPKWCETCNPKNAPVTQRQLRLAREAAIPSYPTDQACVACNRRVRGSGATDKYSRWVAHITHFEVYHYSGTRRRDAARLKRAQREGTGRVDEACARSTYSDATDTPARCAAIQSSSTSVHGIAKDRSHRMAKPRR